MNPPGSVRAALARDVVTALDDSACLASHRVVVAPGLLRTCAVQLNRLVKQLAERVVLERGTARGAHRSDATVQRDELAKAATEEVAGYVGLNRLRLASQVVIAHRHRARERVVTEGAGQRASGPRRVNSRGWRPHALAIACDRGLLAERVAGKRSDIAQRVNVVHHAAEVVVSLVLVLIAADALAQLRADLVTQRVVGPCQTALKPPRRRGRLDPACGRVVPTRLGHDDLPPQAVVSVLRDPLIDRLRRFDPLNQIAERVTVKPRLQRPVGRRALIAQLHRHRRRVLVEQAPLPVVEVTPFGAVLVDEAGLVTQRVVLIGLGKSCCIGRCQEPAGAIIAVLLTAGDTVAHCAAGAPCGQRVFGARGCVAEQQIKLPALFDAAQRVIYLLAQRPVGTHRKALPSHGVIDKAGRSVLGAGVGSCGAIERRFAEVGQRHRFGVGCALDQAVHGVELALADDVLATRYLHLHAVDFPPGRVVNKRAAPVLRAGSDRAGQRRCLVVRHGT